MLILFFLYMGIGFYAGTKQAEKDLIEAPLREEKRRKTIENQEHLKIPLLPFSQLQK